MFQAGENLEEMAEKELLAAASVIENATAVLLDAKRRAQEKRESMGLADAGISEAIIDAARAIAQATSVLVSSATHCQKEIVISGKASKTTNMYRRDPTWARGLISAAQAVAGSVQMLVKSANDSTTGQGEEEQLVASARGVAAATARLVAASRAKADPMSATQQKLSGAAKAVASATSQLVAAAKAASELADEPEVEFDMNLSATGQKAQEYQAMVEIEKKRRELDKAQKALFSIRKNEYKDKTGNNDEGSSSKPPAQPKPLAPKGTVAKAAAAAAASGVALKKAPAKKPAGLKPAAQPSSPSPQ